MFCRRLLIPAAVLLMLLEPPSGLPESLAGTYTWSPIVGDGYFVSYPENQFIPIQTRDATLTIGYDPSDLSACFIDLETGTGYGAVANNQFMVTASGNGVTFSAFFGNGGVVGASFVGHPGPLNADGYPESLDSLLGAQGSVYVSPSYHGDQLFFGGQTLPEPSSLFTLALGIGGVSFAFTARRMRNRPARRGYAPGDPAGGRPGDIAPTDLE